MSIVVLWRRPGHKTQSTTMTVGTENFTHWSCDKTWNGTKAKSQAQTISNKAAVIDCVCVCIESKKKRRGRLKWFLFSFTFYVSFFCFVFAFQFLFAKVNEILQENFVIKNYLKKSKNSKNFRKVKKRGCS